jgi:hypothetical protein
VWVVACGVVYGVWCMVCVVCVLRGLAHVCNAYIAVGVEGEKGEIKAVTSHVSGALNADPVAGRTLRMS